MKASFWHERWDKDEIAFHESETNLQLLAHFDKLALPKASRVFLPLCGKTRDIAWLLNSGYRVVGAELSELAINALFDELGVEPQISSVGELIHYRAKGIDIFVGDIFDVSTELLRTVDAIYDRAALVALPEAMRNQYTSHLINITGKAPQLLITYAYDQVLMDGPPFSISEEEVKQHYSGTYQLAIVDSLDVAGGLKGKVTSVETTWLLK
ncbi:MAG: thiopurine S-methyltransferase [Pseudomonadales bacterium]|nr:thiopurine S-methyltransferase [Pseudomonadales bacterium]